MANTPIPLTTTFTPPADCLASLTSSSGTLQLGANSTCLPAGADNAEFDVTFSPAWICPSGWIVASLSSISISTLTETVAACCPQSQGLSVIQYAISLDDTAYQPQCVTAIPASFTYLTVTDGTTSTASVTNRSSIVTVQATAIQIAWQANDLLPRTSLSASLTSQTSSATSVSTAEQHTDGGLSQINKIIIGVVVPIAALVSLVALGFFIICRRRSHKGKTAREIQQVITQDTSFHSHVAAATTTMGKYVSSGGVYTALDQGQWERADRDPTTHQNVNDRVDWGQRS